MAAGDVALGSFSSLGFASRSGSAWPIGRGVVGAGAFEIVLHFPSARGPHGAGEKTVRYRRVKLQALRRRLSNRSTFRGLRN